MDQCKGVRRGRRLNKVLSEARRGVYCLVRPLPSRQCWIGTSSIRRADLEIVIGGKLSMNFPLVLFPVPLAWHAEAVIKGGPGGYLVNSESSEAFLSPLLVS